MYVQNDSTTSSHTFSPKETLNSNCLFGSQSCRCPSCCSSLLHSFDCSRCIIKMRCPIYTPSPPTHPPSPKTPIDVVIEPSTAPRSQPKPIHHSPPTPAPVEEGISCSEGKCTSCAECCSPAIHTERDCLYCHQSFCQTEDININN